MVYGAYGNTAYFSHTSRSSIITASSTAFVYWIALTRKFEFGRKPCQKQTLPLEARGPPCNTSMPGPTPLTTPNDSSIALRTSTQRCNKVPIGYNKTPQIHPQTAPSLRRSPPKSNTPLRSPTPLTTPNGIPTQSAI